MTTRKNSRARWSSMAGLLAVACLDGSLSAQARPGHVGLPDDWSHRHLMFSNPGNYEQMVERGASQETRQEWLTLQQDIRFKMQLVKRHRARVSGSWDSIPDMLPVPDGVTLQAANDRVADKTLDRELNAAEKAADKAGATNPTAMQRDWNIKLGKAPPEGMYPAKFTFDINAAPDCANDYVVFPIADNAVVGKQANLIAFNNLYTPGLCGSATAPTFKFSYAVGTGVIRTSPVLSLDGRKVAVVESSAGVGQDSAIFHVITIGTTGNNGTSTAGVAVGAAGGNNAVDTSLPISSGGVGVTRSSPFIDYAADVAYVGDDAGNIHKFTGVFTGALAEAGAPWPRSVGALTTLTGPVAWNGNIFVSGSTGSLYCITTAGLACANPSLIMGTVPILDPPIVDGSTNEVFVATQTANSSILVQVSTLLASRTTGTHGECPRVANSSPQRGVRPQLPGGRRPERWLHVLLWRRPFRWRRRPDAVPSRFQRRRSGQCHT